MQWKAKTGMKKKKPKLKKWLLEVSKQMKESDDKVIRVGDILIYQGRRFEVLGPGPVIEGAPFPLVLHEIKDEVSEDLKTPFYWENLAKGFEEIIEKQSKRIDFMERLMRKALEEDLKGK